MATRPTSFKNVGELTAATTLSEDTKFYAIDGTDKSAALGVLRKSIGGSVRLENRPAFRDFYNALYAYSLAPESTRFAMACYGDSVAPHVWSQLVNLLAQAIPIAELSGPGVSGRALERLVLTGATYDPLSVSVSPGVMDGVGGFADFTYLPGADHITLGDGGVLTWSVDEFTGFTEALVYLATGPGMGSATVTLQDEAGATVNEQTADLAGASLGATKLAFETDSTEKHRLQIVADGVVVHIQTLFLKPHGIVSLNFARGSSSLAQNNYSSDAILDYLVSDLNLAILVAEAKEDSGSDGTAEAMARFASMESTSKLIIGSLPDSSDQATQIANNAELRTIALANDFAFFDGYGAVGSYAELVRLGWISDGTHALTPANRFVAGLIASELQLTDWMAGAVRRSVVVEYPHDMSAWIYRVFDGDSSGESIDVIVNAGGGTPGKVIIQNLRRVILGPNSGTTPCLAPNGDAVGCFTPDDSWAPMKAAYFESMSGTDAIFAGGVRVGLGKAVRYKEGVNAAAGVATLVAGAVVVSTTAVSATSRIKLTPQSLGTISRPAALGVTARTAGVSFTVTSSDATDTSVVYWEIMEPAP